ncbi:hypothetical protein ISN45_At01g026510 [Arabidopsis thaliana x Arabidopsis arenosa]|uniref:Uncharacterized protein n=2 Tax=Arabidopsis TaxID=3701 RepID=A0A8T2H5M8_ARASU|nr:hypothetical protein ISN45_At01g026510 [Arabidopsis thaliana x Arabidopsis arenosa]KAG7655561.1 hypothetical protein ISN44_As01g026290 [Arabidopsis suecica]
MEIERTADYDKVWFTRARVTIIKRHRGNSIESID